MKASKFALDPCADSDLWDDSQTQPGDLWDQDIEVALAQTRIALLLLSKSYLEST